MTGDEELSQHPDPDEQDEVFGPIDAGALREIRDLCVDQEPLVRTAALDDPLNPQTLSVELSDGVGDATAARIDIRWSLTGNYAAHYTDDADRDFRFDCHPKPDAPRRHFHPPPAALSRPVEGSCIAVSEAGLVTRAILQRWRYAYTNETFSGINDAENPP
ncbi:hypothetical protein SAMN05192561_11724 [Halopenitus malekzadehii]|uniref:Uncharacterized protein n=1 Tax=Halopenitus malekzadehii TaxID=1267564 RepID=A0A1H6JS61_9EURY|nr:hypothetical protein [Halopenitus malekzadehii]SEH63774.1 hypothetical protein SAMN05192561_11724 [Halopenitus malekzadehii]